MDFFPAVAVGSLLRRRDPLAAAAPQDLPVALNSSHPQDHGAGRQPQSPDDSPAEPSDFTRPAEDRLNQNGEAAGAGRTDRIGGRTEDFVDSVESAIHRRVPKKVQQRHDPRQNTVINVIWRAGVLVVGLCLIGVGVVLLVLPGPGWGAILLGLVVLASEYTWANRLLGPLRRRVKAEAVRLRSRSRKQQVAVGITTVVLTLTLMGFGLWYVATYGWTLP